MRRPTSVPRPSLRGWRHRNSFSLVVRNGNRCRTPRCPSRISVVGCRIRSVLFGPRRYLTFEEKGGPPRQIAGQDADDMRTNASIPPARLIIPFSRVTSLAEGLRPPLPLLRRHGVRLRWFGTPLLDGPLFPALRRSLRVFPLRKRRGSLLREKRTLVFPSNRTNGPIFLRRSPLGRRRVLLPFLRSLLRTCTSWFGWWTSFRCGRLRWWARPIPLAHLREFLPGNAPLAPSLRVGGGRLEGSFPFTLGHPVLHVLGDGLLRIPS